MYVFINYIYKFHPEFHVSLARWYTDERGRETLARRVGYREIYGKSEEKNQVGNKNKNDNDNDNNNNNNDNKHSGVLKSIIRMIFHKDVRNMKENGNRQTGSGRLFFLFGCCFFFYHRYSCIVFKNSN